MKVPYLWLRQNGDTLEIWTAHQQDERRLNAPVSEPKFGVTRQVVVADTDEEALPKACEAHGDW